MSTYVAIKDLVYDIVEDVWGYILHRDNEIATIRQHRGYYEKKSSSLRNKVGWLSSQQALRWEVNDLVLIVVDEMCDDICTDLLKVCYFSENIIINFVSEAISTQRKTQMPEDNIKRLLRAQLDVRPGDAEENERLFQ